MKKPRRVSVICLWSQILKQKIMGYELSENMNAENVVKALKMAVRNRITHPQLIHQSDRCLQYCSEIYQKVLRENKIKSSMKDGYDAIKML